MFPEILFLAGEELHNWLRTNLTNIFTSDMSGASILATLREGGVQIRTSDFYDIRREVLASQTEQLTFAENISGLADNNLIPRAWHGELEFPTQGENFLYRVSVTGVNALTGLADEHNYMIIANRQLTVGTVKDYGRTFAAREGEGYEINNPEVEITGAWEYTE